MPHAFTPVLEFWFMELDPRQWFTNSGSDLDALILKRFGVQVDQALEGKLDDWAATPRGRLALIIVLDQFTRNALRGNPRAYAGDTKAQQLAYEGIMAGMDKELSFSERQFFYLPFMHAEDPSFQKLSIQKFDELRNDVAAVLDIASGHAAIIERFGRFPHRNKTLGRASTQEENAFLSSKENRFA